MHCPECHQLNEAEAAVCTSCGLILLNLAPKRRTEDLATQKRRSADVTAPCRFCGGHIPPSAIRCRHCSEIVNDEFYRERAARIRSRVNYASWVAYIFGLGALLVFRPVGVVSIAAGMMLSIIFYAVPVEPPESRPRRRSIGSRIARQFSFDRVSVPFPFMRKMKFVFVGTPLVAALVGLGANMLLLQRPVDAILEQNAAFQGMDVSAHYQYWVVPGVVVYDLRSLSFRQRPIDVHTAFLEFARELKEKNVRRVELAYKGNTRFSIAGDDFRKIGEEYEKKNFDYVLYTFPKLFQDEAEPKLKEDSASDRDSLLQFHKRWYGDDGMTQQAIAQR
jgi:predicted nucleic acid-binding Zn ribbon protein